jgi:hypothetical protein
VRPHGGEATARRCVHSAGPPGRGGPVRAHPGAREPSRVGDYDLTPARRSRVVVR